MQHRWKHIKYPFRAIFGQRMFNLRLMAWLCYGNWERWSEKNYKRYGLSLSPGFSGSAVIMTRKGISNIGEWDPSQQGADYDMMTRSIEYWHHHDDMQPCMIINGVYCHHYRRISADEKFPPFKDASNLIELEEKWKDNSRPMLECFAINKTFKLPAK